MLEQLAGAATATVLVLTYLLLVEVLTAACLLLAQYIGWQIRALRSVIGTPSKPAIETQAAEEPHTQTYRLGGDLRW